MNTQQAVFLIGEILQRKIGIISSIAFLQKHMEFNKRFINSLSKRLGLDVCTNADLNPLYDLDVTKLFSQKQKHFNKATIIHHIRLRCLYKHRLY